MISSTRSVPHHNSDQSEHLSSSLIVTMRWATQQTWWQARILWLICLTAWSSSWMDHSIIRSSTSSLRLDKSLTWESTSSKSQEQFLMVHKPALSQASASQYWSRQEESCLKTLLLSLCKIWLHLLLQQLVKTNSLSMWRYLILSMQKATTCRSSLISAASLPSLSMTNHWEKSCQTEPLESTLISCLQERPLFQSSYRMIIQLVRCQRFTRSS